MLSQDATTELSDPMGGLSRNFRESQRVDATSSDRPNRVQLVLLGLVLAATVLLWFLKLNSYQLGTHFDDSRYVILARSLLESDMYGMINHPDGPVPERYPFGYPLLLAPILAVAPGNFAALTALSLGATILNISLIFFGWRWIGKGMSYWWGLGFTAWYALSPMVIDLNRRVMSETVFKTFCLIVILLAERRAAGIRSRWWTTGMSVALTFVAYTRSIGIVLVACAFLYLLWVLGRRFWREIALILVQMTALLGIILWVTPIQLRDLLPLEYLKDENARALIAPFETTPPASVPVVAPAVAPATPQPAGWQSKIASLRDLFVFGTVQHFGRDIASITLPIGGGAREQAFADRIGIPSFPLAIGYTISAIVLVGLVRWWVRFGGSLFLLFGVVYFAAIFFWYWNDPRLLYPIQVQLYLALFLGLEVLLSAFARLFRRRIDPARNETASNRIFQPGWVLAPLVVIFILISAYKSITIEDSRLHAGDMRSRTLWLEANSNPADVIMTEAPETDFLYSGRKTLAYPGPAVQSAEALDSYLQQRHIQYVLVAPEIKWMIQYRPEYTYNTNRILPFIDVLAVQNRVRLVHSSDPELIRVYQVLQ